MKVFRDLFCKIGIIALWFIGIFLMAIILLQIIFIATGVEDDISISSLNIAFSIHVWILVIGIVYPLIYFNHYIEAGITRKQFFIGFLMAGTVISLCFSFLRIPFLVIEYDFSLLNLILQTLNSIISLLMGWTAVVGFQFMRKIPIILGKISGISILVGMILLETFQVSPLIQLPILILSIAVVSILLLKAVVKIPIKC